MKDLNNAIGLINAGRFGEALVILKALEKKSKQDNWIKINLANCHIHLNDFDSAAQELKKVLLSENRNDEFLLYVSKLFLTISLFKHSIQAAKRAVNINNKSLPNIAQLIRACYEGREIETAKRAVNHFLGVDPKNKWAINFKALIASGNGDFQTAEQLYRNLYEQDPTDIMALAGYVKSKKFTEKNKPLFELIEASKRRVSDTSTLARIHLSKAKILNDIESYEEAWEEAIKGNKMMAETNPFNKATYQEYIQSVLSKFDSESLKITSSNNSEHVLIIGMPRSGTTLVEQVLTQVEKYYPGGEVPAIDYALFQTFKGQDYLKGINNLEKNDLNKLAESYEQYFRQFANFNGKLIIDKVPSNYLHIGLFKKLFPKSKIINLQRNKFDIIASMMFTEFGQMLNYTNDIESINFVYEQYEMLMSYWQECFPEDILNIHYDEFIINNEEARSELCQFLSIPELSNKYENSSNAVETPSVWQVRQGLYTNAINRWKRYPKLVQYATNAAS